MGGYPSQTFASMFPEMVEGFTALDTTPFGTKYYSKADLWWLKQVGPMAERFSGGMLRKSMAKSVSKTAYSYNKMMEMLKPLTKAQIIEQMGIAYGKFTAENQKLNLRLKHLYRDYKQFMLGQIAECHNFVQSESSTFSPICYPNDKAAERGCMDVRVA